MKETTPHKATEAETSACVESERSYQQERFPGHSHDVLGWLGIMSKCLHDAYSRHTTDRSSDAVLHEVRQVVAVGFACLQEHGAPKRGDEIKTTGRILLS